MNLRRGTLYGVGVGPGDPELLTVKAVKTLQRSDVILVPDTGKQNQVALNIVRDYVEGKTLHYVSTPMVRDQAVVQRAYDSCADLVCQMLEEGKQVAYITLGDPSIYSTYLYIQQRVTARGYSAEMIPGIPSFCAAAAKLNCSLCEGNEPLMILPASGESNPKRVNKVYMKAGRSILALQEQLRQQGVLEQASLVENCGLPGERILPHFGDLQEPTGYFSLVISKEEQP
jgi:precorrin-2/cobalt-factor-2 C20-methyltransferase